MVKNFAVKSSIITSAIYQLADQMAHAIYWSEHSTCPIERKGSEERMEHYDQVLAGWLDQVKKWKMSPAVYRDSFDEAVKIHLAHIGRERM